MRSIIIICLLFAFYGISAQCPYTATLLAKNGTCIGDKLTVQTTHGLSKIVWYKDGLPVDSALATQQVGNSIVVAGNNGPGSADNQLRLIDGIYVDDYGNIFVSDGLNNRVQKWPPGAISGITVAGGNGPGNAPNQLDYPFAVSVDKLGNIFVLDQNNYNYRVTKWAPGSNVGTVVVGGNGRGSAANQLYFPSGMYLDCTGGIYITQISDVRGGEIRYWAAGEMNAIIIAGSQSDYKFNNPGSLWLDGQNNIFVTDVGCSCVAEIKHGENTGTMIIGGRETGAQKPVIPFPTGIYVDNYDNVTIGDQKRISWWKSGYSNGITLFKDASNVNNSGVYTFVDNKGNLYVTSSIQSTATGEDFNGTIYKLPLIVNIDSTYKATSAGTYYALITDVNGYTSSTDSIEINAPAAIPASIKIFSN